MKARDLIERNRRTHPPTVPRAQSAIDRPTIICRPMNEFSFFPLRQPIDTLSASIYKGIMAPARDSHPKDKNQGEHEPNKD
jgi:hypothetical protein